MYEKNSERKIIIKELQELAEKVLKLKTEHRQKRPIVIEFSGSPKAGKTSCINSLELFLKRNGFTVQIIQERASICPVSNKQSPMFNLWTSCMSLSGLIGILENKENNVDILILDRGIFDALCWFEWLVDNKMMEEEQRRVAESFFLMDEIVKSIDIVFAFKVQPNMSIEREYANLLTDKLGTIMNIKVLSEYLNAIENTISMKKKFFHKIFLIDTSNKNQDEVGQEVTTNTLNTLSDLLMEKIGYFDRTDKLSDLLSTNTVFSDNQLTKFLPELKFGLREKIESSTKYIQPIPIAIITNKLKNKVLVIKKNKNAVSSDSPERDRTLLYVGGHSRFEDETDVINKDFLSVCRIALKRELKEEIGISVALNEINPFYIYSPTSEKSKKHIAVCFEISIDEESTKLHLDSHELVLNKGRSKSGKFNLLTDLDTIDLEDWSQIILDRCFGIHAYKPQISLINYMHENKLDNT